MLAAFLLLLALYAAGLLWFANWAGRAIEAYVADLERRKAA